MRGSDDRTPLDLARRDEHGDLVQLLLLQADPSQVLQLNWEMYMKMIDIRMLNCDIGSSHLL